MARSTTKQLCDTVTNSEPLVVVKLSWWAKFVMPASVASELLKHLANPQVVRVEEHDSMFIPVSSDWSIEHLDQPFIADLPIKDEEMRKAYLAWVKTKRELGDKSQPQPYAVFKQLHDEGEA